MPPPLRLLLLTLAACAGQSPANVDTDSGVEPALSCPAFTTTLDQEYAGWELMSNELTPSGSDPSYVGPGVAVFDADEDGDLDLALGVSIGDTFIWHNDGAGNFERSEAPMVGAQALAVGDVDGDHRPELFLGRSEGYGDQIVYLDGRAAIHLGDSEGHTTGGSFGDPDGDGELDLAISRHIELFMPDDIASGDAVGGGNQLFRNDDQVFTELVDALPAGLEDATSFQALWLDADRDGQQDLYWANDFGWLLHPNALLMGQGDGTFIAAGDSGAELATATMGVSAGDIDGDGVVDMWSSDAGSPDLLLGDGYGGFYQAGVATGAFLPMDDEHASSWGTAIVDLDLDGRPELLAAYGPINFWIVDAGTGGVILPSGEALEDPQAQRSVLLYQQADGQFADVSESTGFDLRGIQRSVVAADLDLDGRPELITTGWEDKDTPVLRIWRVQGGCDPGLTVRIDDAARYDGAVLTARVDGTDLVRPLHHGSAFSSGSLETSVPVGADGTVDIQITLPGGESLEFSDVESGALIVRPWEE